MRQVVLAAAVIAATACGRVQAPPMMTAVPVAVTSEAAGNVNRPAEEGITQQGYPRVEAMAPRAMEAPAARAPARAACRSLKT